MPFPSTGSPLRDLPAAHYRPLSEDRQADVVVIGAGIAGLTTAALLARQGREVVVLEARHVAAGTSGHTTAKVSHGTVRAGHVVVATLLPITDRGLLFARAQPRSSHLVALDVDGPLPQGMYLRADEPTRSLRTARHDGREVLLVGGGGHVTGRGAPTLPRHHELVDWASDHFPVTDVVARWSAHDHVPADHLPWVGAASPLSPPPPRGRGLRRCRGDRSGHLGARPARPHTHR